MLLTRVCEGGGVDRSLEKSFSSLSSATSVGHLLFLFVCAWGALGPSTCLCLWCVCVCVELFSFIPYSSLYLSPICEQLLYLRPEKVDLFLWFDREERRRKKKTQDK
jgi:hypothetical protein